MFLVVERRKGSSPRRKPWECGFPAVKLRRSEREMTREKSAAPAGAGGGIKPKPTVGTVGYSRGLLRSDLSAEIFLPRFYEMAQRLLSGRSKGAWTFSEIKFYRGP